MTNVSDTRVSETRNDTVRGVWRWDLVRLSQLGKTYAHTEGLGDSQVWGRSNWRRTTEHEPKLRSTGTVADTDGTSELDAKRRIIV